MVSQGCHAGVRRSATADFAPEHQAEPSVYIPHLRAPSSLSKAFRVSKTAVVMRFSLYWRLTCVAARKGTGLGLPNQMIGCTNFW